jgi:hypothetical protein
MEMAIMQGAIALRYGGKGPEEMAKILIKVLAIREFHIELESDEKTMTKDSVITFGHDELNARNTRDKFAMILASIELMQPDISDDESIEVIYHINRLVEQKYGQYSHIVKFYIYE